MREIKVGDRVEFLNDVGEGVVLELSIRKSCCGRY